MHTIRLWSSNDKLRVMRHQHVFHTLQGEGKLSGVPSTFLRLAGCDLRCHTSIDGTGWSCDTPTSLPDFNVERGEFLAQPSKYARDIHVEELAAQLWNSDPSHIVITGGEPTLQASALRSFLGALFVWHKPHATLETNGRHFDPGLAAAIDLVSLSPKVHQPSTVDMEAYGLWLVTANDVQVKIVMADVGPAPLVYRLFEHARLVRRDATLYVQRADVPRSEAREAGHASVLHWVMNNRKLRDLGVRYATQLHKAIGVP